jgi:hypothetical protein
MIAAPMPREAPVTSATRAAEGDEDMGRVLQTADVRKRNRKLSRSAVEQHLDSGSL